MFNGTHQNAFPVIYYNCYRNMTIYLFSHLSLCRDFDCRFISDIILYYFNCCVTPRTSSPSWWRHNDHAGVSNHQPHGCLLNRLFRRRSKKTPKLRVTGLCAGNSPGPVNSPHKGPVTRKMFPFDDVIMPYRWHYHRKRPVSEVSLLNAGWHVDRTARNRHRGKT